MKKFLFLILGIQALATADELLGRNRRENLKGR
jgi:hypothetical protein